VGLHVTIYVTAGTVSIYTRKQHHFTLRLVAPYCQGRDTRNDANLEKTRTADPFIPHSLRVCDFEFHTQSYF